MHTHTLLMRTHTNQHTHTPYTHARTHARTRVSLSLFLSFSLSLTHSLTHTHTLSLSLSLSHTAGEIQKISINIFFSLSLQSWHGHLVDICAGECTQEFLQLATWNSCKNGCSRCTGCHH